MPCFIRSCTFVTLTNRIYVYVLQFHDSWGAVVQHRSMLLPTRLAAAAGHCLAAPHRNRRQLRQERVRVKVKVRRHGGLQALELLEAPLRPKHPQGLMRFQTLGAPRRPMHPQDLESQKHHSSPFEARGPGAPSVPTSEGLGVLSLLSRAIGTASIFFWNTETSRAWHIGRPSVWGIHNGGEEAEWWFPLDVLFPLEVSERSGG